MVSCSLLMLSSFPAASATPSVRLFLTSSSSPLISCDFSGDTVFVCLIKSELLPDFFYIQFFFIQYGGLRSFPACAPLPDPS